MIKKINRRILRLKRKVRIRKKVFGTADAPRLAVYRSNLHIYAQLIDDTTHQTIVSASTVEPEVRKTLKHGANVAAAEFIGDLVAKRALEKGIQCVVFDRGGFLYHGRIKALADKAREAGLFF
jgi:large subunit ribosomal protein L18